MTFTPFTRDALTRIKNGATAHELGWSETFYARICREHAIAPTVYRPITHTPPEIAAPPITPPISWQTVVLKKPKLMLPDECLFNELHGWLCRGKVEIHLPPMQARLLRTLARRSVQDDITTPALATIMGVSELSIKIYVSNLRAHLRKVAITIPRLTSRGWSSFVLIDDKTNAPAKINFVGGAP